MTGQRQTHGKGRGKESEQRKLILCTKDRHPTNQSINQSISHSFSQSISRCLLKAQLGYHCFISVAYNNMIDARTLKSGVLACTYHSLHSGEWIWACVILLHFLYSFWLLSVIVCGCRVSTGLFDQRGEQLGVMDCLSRHLHCSCK